MKQILLAAVCCSNLITTPSAYTLKGHIDGAKTGWVYLMHRQKEKNNLDSVQIKDGQFSFTGKVESPEFCYLGLKNKEGYKEWRIGFFLDKGQISLEASKDSLDKAKITGSPTEDEHKVFLTGLEPIENASNAIYVLMDSAEKTKNTALLDSLQKATKDNNAQKQQYIKGYAVAHPTSIVVAYEIYANYSYDPDADLLQDLYGSFDPSLKTAYYGVKVKETLDKAILTSVGKPAPQFTQANTQGTPLALSSLKGKYVLVDFWASWCGPCRAENPNVLSAYKKYHDKGFTVLGVSLDNNKQRWLEAIKKDQLDWNQVSDLKGWENSVAKQYGIQGIPMNFLLDREGKIVAKGLRGEDLDKKLAELLQ